MVTNRRYICDRFVPRSYHLTSDEDQSGETRDEQKHQGCQQQDGELTLDEAAELDAIAFLCDVHGIKDDIDINDVQAKAAELQSATTDQVRTSRMSTIMPESIIIDGCCNTTIRARAQPEIVRALQAQERQRRSRYVLRGADNPEATGTLTQVSKLPSLCSRSERDTVHNDGGQANNIVEHSESEPGESIQRKCAQASTPS